MTLNRARRGSARARAFEKWIEEKGVDALAQTLRVDPATIRHWKARRCDPRVEHIRALVKLSKGRLTYAMIIERETPTNVDCGKR